MFDPVQRGLRPIVWIMLAVMVWGALHALGTYLFNLDYRKPLIVYGFVAAFLAFWTLLLALRSRRLHRQEINAAASREQPDRKESV